MDDLISRQAAIDAAIEATKKWDGLYPQGLNCEIQEAVNALPSAQPEQRWIKTSERLPKMWMMFYATVRSLVDDRKNWVIEGFYNPVDEWGKIPMIEMGKAEVIAWMPKEFPSPYQEEREGEG